MAESGADVFVRDIMFAQRQSCRWKFILCVNTIIASYLRHSCMCKLSLHIHFLTRPSCRRKISLQGILADAKAWNCLHALIYCHFIFAIATKVILTQNKCPCIYKCESWWQSVKISGLNYFALGVKVFWRVLGKRSFTWLINLYQSWL